MFCYQCDDFCLFLLQKPYHIGRVPIWILMALPVLLTHSPLKKIPHMHYNDGNLYFIDYDWSGYDK